MEIVKKITKDELALIRAGKNYYVTLSDELDSHIKVGDIIYYSTLLGFNRIKSKVNSIIMYENFDDMVNDFGCELLFGTEELMTDFRKHYLNQKSELLVINFDIL